MIKPVVTVLLIICSIGVNAEPWEFGKKILVTSAIGPKVFHHIDSSGRRSIAMSGESLAVTWEDNRNGSPQIYISFKRVNENSFSAEKRLSTGSEAYDPTIQALGNGKFMVAWEQDGIVFASVTDARQHSQPVQLSQSGAGQVSLAMIDDTTIVAAWSQISTSGDRIMVTQVTLGNSNNELKAAVAVPVDTGLNEKYKQYFPVVTARNKMVTVVWEDRRNNHTALMYSSDSSRFQFDAPLGLNEIVKKSSKYGSGSGVMRVAVTSIPEVGMAATWMDKRAFKMGYDIYAAFGMDKNLMQFGKNEIVQDDFGESIPQWNPSITNTSAGSVAIAWEDSRDDNKDIWLSWKESDGWSSDYKIDPASGENEQTSPSLTTDASGNLHLIWIESEKQGSDTRLYYSLGRLIRH